MNRYQNIPTTKNSPRGIPFYVNAVYPDIPLSDSDSYLISTRGDRMDIMAQKFYGDVDLWWIIASANSLTGDSLFPPIGMQLRIPANIQSIINDYNQINTIR